jgi:superfamily II DNA or RNA helicase
MSLTRTLYPGIRKERCLNKKHEREFIPQPHQQKIADYFLDSPHRGLLLYHLLGSGKSCTSILVAKTMLETKKVNHVYVLTPGSLRTNFINEFCKICGDVKTLHKYYTFITYNYNIFESIKNIDFEDSLVIIDEAHNLINGAKNVSKNPHSIYVKILNSNAKVLVLTGTVIFNNIYEWCLLGNLLKSDTFPNIIEDDKLSLEYFEIHKDEIFSKTNLAGIISYFPGNIGEYPDVIYNEPIKVRMSPPQETMYNAIANKEEFIRLRGPPKPDLKFTDPAKFATQQLIWIIAQKYIMSRSISNLVYPNEKYEDENDDLDPKKCELIIYNIENNKEVPSSANISIDKDGMIDSRKKKKDMLEKYGGWINRSILTDRKLSLYSPKIVALITNILKNINSKHVVFSYFIEHGGIRFIHNVFKLCKIKSIIYSGDVSAERRQRILNKFNNPNNRYGEKIKVLLMTEAGREGITFKEVGHLHILETNTIANNTKQIIGRVARYKSHTEMPVEERKVNIWKYHSYTGNQMCIKDKLDITLDIFDIFETDLVPEDVFFATLQNKIENELFDSSLLEDSIYKKIIENFNFKDILLPDFKNFSQYYDYFIKNGYEPDNSILINEYLTDIKGGRIFKGSEPFYIRSIDNYLDERGKTKFKDFGDFYTILQENSIETTGLV